MLKFIKRYRCPYCGDITEEIVSCCECARTLKMSINESARKTQHCDQYTAPFLYKDKVKQAIHKFKFENRPYMAKSFAEMMILCNIQEADVVAEVPKYSLKYYYNSSELLSKELAYRLNKPYLKNAAIKIKNTENQQNLNKTQRLKNLRDCFSVNSECVFNKKILICDDIITTGATIDELAKQYKKNGAKKVYGISIAYNDLAYEGGGID